MRTARSPSAPGEPHAKPTRSARRAANICYHLTKTNDLVGSAIQLGHLGRRLKQVSSAGQVAKLVLPAGQRDEQTLSGASAAGGRKLDRFSWLLPAEARAGQSVGLWAGIGMNYSSGQAGQASAMKPRVAIDRCRSSAQLTLNQIRLLPAWP